MNIDEKTVIICEFFLILAVVFGAIGARLKHRLKKEEKEEIKNSLPSCVKWSMITTCLAFTFLFTVVLIKASCLILTVNAPVGPVGPVNPVGPVEAHDQWFSSTNQICTSLGLLTQTGEKISFAVNIDTHKKYYICIACSFLVLFGLSLYIHVDSEDLGIEPDKMKSIKHESLVSTILSAVAFVCVALFSLARLS